MREKLNKLRGVGRKLLEKAERWRAFRVLREYLLFRGLKHVDLICALAAAALLLFCWLAAMPFSEAASTTTDISLGYSARQDLSGLYYVVDDGHMRFLCFDDGGNIRYAVSNPSDGEGVLYIDDFDVADGVVYLSASEWDGMLLRRELIAEFKNGRYVRTVTERDYSGMTVNKHCFNGIRVRDGVLAYVESQENALVFHQLRLEDGEETTERVYLYNAFNAVCDCAIDGSAFYVLKRNGTVTAFEDGRRATIYTTRWQGETERIPYRMAISPGGDLCFTDIRSREAVRIDTEEQTTRVLAGGISSQTIHYTDDGFGRLYLEDDGLRVDRSGDSRMFTTLSKPLRQLALQVLWLISVAVCAVLLAALAFRVAVFVFTRTYAVPQMVSLWVITVVAVVSALLCGMLISTFSDVYRHQIMDQMENDAFIVANQIPSRTISQIRHAEDFDGDAYLTLVEVMERVFPMDLDLNRQLYCNIMTMDDEGEPYAVAYLDQSTAVYFPQDEFETAEIRQMYRDGTGGALWSNALADVTGTYLAVKVPIFDNGKISGVVEVGVDTFVVRNMVRSLRIQILLSIVIIIMIIWLIATEVMSWFSNVETYRRSLAAGHRTALPAHLVRLLVFAIFTVYNMSSTFLPVWILRNSELFDPAQREFMASLPLTVNIFFIGFMSLFTAGVVRRWGMSRILTVSASVSLCANMVMFLFPGYFTLLVGLAVDGVGVGLMTNGTYILLTNLRDEDSRQEGFFVYNAASMSGVNFGMMLGSLFAVIFGQRAVFVIMAMVWGALIVLGQIILRALSSALGGGEEEAAAEAEISMGRFLFSKPISSFIVLLQNPYIILGSFIYYYVPIWCGNQGMDETIVSILIMVYSEVAVLGGDAMMERVTKLLGNRGMYLAFATNIVALMVFALSPNMLGLVIAMILMGSADGYGKPLQQTWLLKQKPVKQYGEDRAMGICNFSDNIGQSVGPIVFARLMACRPLLGAVSVFCGAVTACGAAHLGLNRKEMKTL